MASFYDLDYIIELNEKRLRYYWEAYQKNVERYTILLVIYSAFTIFLLPIIQSLFFTGGCHWLHHLSFYIFVFFFLISLFYTVRLLVPADVYYQQEPRAYYKELRAKYEKDGNNKLQTDELLKASYIYELQKCVSESVMSYTRKSRFYALAFVYAILAILPYLVSLGFHVEKEANKTRTIEIVK